MNVHHVALLIFCCVCELSSAVRIVANQTTENPDDCNLLSCPSQPCTRVFFSEKDSTCIFLDCDDDGKSCDVFLAELGGKIQKEGPNRKNTSDPLQPPSPSPKSTASPPPTAPPASTTTTAATLSLSAPVAHPEVKQHLGNSTTPDPRFSSNTSSSSQEGDQGQVQNKTEQNGVLGQALSNTSKAEALKPVVMSSTQNGPPGQVQNMTTQNGHQGQPSVEPPTPTPTSPPVPVASKGAGNISSSMPKEQNGTRMNKTGQTTTTTTTTTTTSDTPALPTNSTTANATTLTSMTVTPTSSTTSKVTSLPSTTQTQPTSTPLPTPPPPPPSSRSPASSPSVTPSTPPPGKNPSPTSSRAPDVTSDQNKAIEETAGGELTSHFVNTNSLIAVLIFGLLFLIVTVILFLRHAYESYKRRGYTQMDYLINGMYSDSGL
ncbi:hypothetical protein KOW79_007641 [Hemibagrus wyckioides]|uniref:MANSC domain-containing protein n=1 Tax=Hemibagrus wyckioides TaxID=337641 RepID=A0A9D3SME2_9TELE|nr:uncharacterized protein C11orf24 homolog isoform X2 [Hemibagrus wyckioides]KAG7329467.1 hypothetical protein KOW79_007641 [Hemibagrus wyckioides]